MNKNEFLLSKYFRNQQPMNFLSYFRNILTPDLFLLIKERKCAELKGLINSNPKFLEITNKRGNNLLWHAMSLGKHEIADMLLTAGIATKGCSYRPIVNTIALRGDLEMFELFVEKHKISFLEGEESRTFEQKFTSAGCGCGKICEHKEFVYRKNVSSPILCDAIRGKNRFIIRKVISHVNIENENEDGRTALHVACKMIDVDMVEFLLQHHADPNHVTLTPKPYLNLEYYAFTPTNYAIMLCDNKGIYESENEEKYFRIIKSLLSAGGKINISSADISLMRPNLFALLYEYLPGDQKQIFKLEYLFYSNNISEIKKLLSKDNYNTFFSNLSLPIHPLNITIKKYRLDILIYLIEIFKDRLTEHDYEFLITKTVEHNNEHIFKYIYNLSPASREKSHKKALIFAIKNKNMDIVNFLLGKGAQIDPEIFNQAWYIGNYEIIKILINTGYNANRNPDLLYQHRLVKNVDEFLRSVKLVLDRGFDINNRGTYNPKHIIEELVDFEYITTLLKCRLLCLLLTYPNLNYNIEYVNSRLNSAITKYENKQYTEMSDGNEDFKITNTETGTSESLNIYIPILRSLMNNKIECCICYCHNEKFASPCNHSVICIECARMTRNCPQCTKPLK